MTHFVIPIYPDVVHSLMVALGKKITKNQIVADLLSMLSELNENL